jgi:hypothetical protein
MIYILNLGDQVNGGAEMAQGTNEREILRSKMHLEAIS